MANYSAVIVSTALAESKEKKTPCVRLLVNTVKCLDTDQEEKRQFYADLWLGEKAVDRTMKTLREIGWDGMSFYDLNMENTLVGTEIEISTAIEEWNGQSFERVKFVNKKGSYENRGLKLRTDLQPLVDGRITKICIPIQKLVIGNGTKNLCTQKRCAEPRRNNTSRTVRPTRQRYYYERTENLQNGRRKVLHGLCLRDTFRGLPQVRSRQGDC